MKKAIGVAAAIALVLATALPAQAGGWRHGHGHGHHHGSGAAIAFGALAGGLLLGALLSRPAYPEPYPVYQPVVPAPPPVAYYPPAQACQPTTGTGYVNGRLASFAGTWCVDAYGNGYVVPGSQRFVGYLQ